MAKGIKLSDISCITGVVLVVLAILMIAYAMRMFYWRAKMIREVGFLGFFPPRAPPPKYSTPTLPAI